MILHKYAVMICGLLVLDYTSNFAFAQLTGQQILSDLQSQLSNGSEVIYTSQDVFSSFTPR